jgi:hypothetical protein
MNSKTSKRANHCQQKRAAQRPWLERGPFLAADDEPDELDELESEALDAMDDEWPPERLGGFS